jgi:hypothetical protein
LNHVIARRRFSVEAISCFGKQIALQSTLATT